MLHLPEPEPSPKPIVSLEDVLAAQEEVERMVSVGDKIVDQYLDLLSRLKALAKPIIPSDRRKRQALAVLKAQAWLEGRMSVRVSDFAALQYVLWKYPEEYTVLGELLAEYGTGVLDKVEEIMKPIREFAQKLSAPGVDLENWDQSTVLAQFMTKLKGAMGLLRRLQQTVDVGTEDDAAVTSAMAELNNYKQKFLEASFGGWEE